MRVLPLDCIAILGIRFGGRVPPSRVPPSDLILGCEALAILGFTDPTTCYGLTNVYLRVRYLKEVLEGEL